MKKVLSLVLSLVMLLGLVVPVSAEDTIFEGNGTLKDKTVAFTIEADKTTLYGEGEQIVKFHIYAESVDNVPIRAFQFTLVPSANLTLATELAGSTMRTRTRVSSSIARAIWMVCIDGSSTRPAAAISALRARMRAKASPLRPRS